MPSRILTCKQTPKSFIEFNENDLELAPQTLISIMKQPVKRFKTWAKVME